MILCGLSWGRAGWEKSKGGDGMVTGGARRGGGGNARSIYSAKAPRAPVSSGSEHSGQHTPESRPPRHLLLTALFRQSDPEEGVAEHAGGLAVSLVQGFGAASGTVRGDLHNALAGVLHDAPMCRGHGCRQRNLRARCTSRSVHWSSAAAPLAHSLLPRATKHALTCSYLLGYRTL